MLSSFMHRGLSRGLGLVRWDLVVVESMHEQAAEPGSEPGLVEKSASAGIRHKTYTHTSTKSSAKLSPPAAHCVLGSRS